MLSRFIDNTLAQGSKSGYAFVTTPHNGGAGTVHRHADGGALSHRTGIKPGYRGFCSNGRCCDSFTVAPTAAPSQQTTDSTCAAYMLMFLQPERRGTGREHRMAIS